MDQVMADEAKTKRVCCCGYYDTLLYVVDMLLGAWLGVPNNQSLPNNLILFSRTPFSARGCLVVSYVPTWQIRYEKKEKRKKEEILSLRIIRNILQDQSTKRSSWDDMKSDRGEKNQASKCNIISKDDSYQLIFELNIHIGGEILYTIRG